MRVFNPGDHEVTERIRFGLRPSFVRPVRLDEVPDGAPLEIGSDGGVAVRARPKKIVTLHVKFDTPER